ncbi:hypothetical protein GUJ93_ZPchr0007g3402 [Zizania palustris]|uniref:Uncharacterized protein n=1 Tax=Zizania palustris TaxID=103762 RepID=A0A8J5TEL9_ZIZPA|nr:hypothetical protein GUJ93_ZPchr0007g3402 [Zizania palustris]
MSLFLPPSIAALLLPLPASHRALLLPLPASRCALLLPLPVSRRALLLSPPLSPAASSSGALYPSRRHVLLLPLPASHRASPPLSPAARPSYVDAVPSRASPAPTPSPRLAPPTTTSSPRRALCSAPTPRSLFRVLHIQSMPTTPAMNRSKSYADGRMQIEPYYGSSSSSWLSSSLIFDV